MKAKLAGEIRDHLERNKLTQTEASYITGEAPSQLSLICTNKLRGFSLERLLRTRSLLGGALNISVTKSHRPAVTCSFAS